MFPLTAGICAVPHCRVVAVSRAGAADAHRGAWRVSVRPATSVGDADGEELRFDAVFLCSGQVMAQPRHGVGRASFRRSSAGLLQRGALSLFFCRGLLAGRNDGRRRCPCPTPWRMSYAARSYGRVPQVSCSPAARHVLATLFVPCQPPSVLSLASAVLGSRMAAAPPPGSSRAIPHWRVRVVHQRVERAAARLRAIFCGRGQSGRLRLFV